jgi:hypothetical protein
MSSVAKVMVMGGKGQVGSELVKILKRKYPVKVLDIDETPEDLHCNILHVAIPYSENFIMIIKEVVDKSKPDYVIVHSTVPVGTCRAIGPNVVHSPVRGQHSALLSGLKRFVKYVGGQNVECERRAMIHLAKVGFKVELMKSPEETELAKLLCLSRYLNDLAFYEVAFRLCKDFKVDETIVKRWVSTYNKGYKGSKYQRPDLDFPMGHVGGTCVLPVSKMLYEQTRDSWLKKNIDLFGGDDEK